MLILDTNVVSEMMKDEPDQAAITWLNDQRPSSLYLTSITLGEIGFGLRILPKGKRRQRLEEGFQQEIVAAFGGRVLAFDEGAAPLYADLMARRRKMGRPLSMADGQIAAIARSRGFGIVTRNVRDFFACSLRVLDPFSPA